MKERKTFKLNRTKNEFNSHLRRSKERNLSQLKFNPTEKNGGKFAFRCDEKFIVVVDIS